MSLPTGMTILIDISCPSCHRSDTVQKHGLGSYRCTECGHEFEHTDLEIDFEE